MKTALLGLVVVVLMAGSGGVGYYFGNENGLKQAQNIRNDFLQQRLGGTGQGAGNIDPSQFQGAQQGQPRGGGQGGQGGQLAAAFGRPIANGTVKTVEGNKVTVTQQDGSTTTVNVDAKATIQKTDNATLTDIKPGLRISVFEQGSGITMTQRIQLTPGQ